MPFRSILLILGATLVAVAQVPPEALRRTFTAEVELPRTPATHQDSTGTCWCFGTTSFMESELLRLGKGGVGLAEMFVVRHTWPRKAMNYFRTQGGAPWSPGGQAHDWLDSVRARGIVPREAYPGLSGGETVHNHLELDAGMKGFMDVVVKAKQPSPRWSAALGGMLDAYLGTPPATFTFRGTTYTPESFRDSLGLRFEDYVELTSFTHQPYYQPFRLEVPDNWSANARYYNLPLEELEAVMVHALRSGHSLVWDGDISEKEYAKKSLGYAYVPGEGKAGPGRPEPEAAVTPELRQRAFDDYRTTDDHLMHMVGLAKDQEGNRFFLVKDSLGESHGPYQGYGYLSLAYVRLKTIAILVNKAAIPEGIRAKLGLN